MLGRKPWRKLWRDRFLGDPAMRDLSPPERGLFMHIFLLVDDNGDLVLADGVPFTTAQVAREINARPHDAERWMTRLQGLKLIRVKEGGGFSINGFMESQTGTKRVRNGYEKGFSETRLVPRRCSSPRGYGDITVAFCAQY